MTIYALRWRLGASAAVAMFFQWSEPTFATGSVGSASATQVVVSYQHPGETAQSHFDGKKYRICVDFEDYTSDCQTTDNQSRTMNGLTVGENHRIRVYCHCKGSGRLSFAYTKTILDVTWRHTAPAAPTPPRIVRLRSAQSGLCLYPQQTGRLHNDTCGPLAIMRFSIENAPGGGTQIRHVASGQCIHGSFPRPNPTVVLAACGKIGTVIWVMDYKNGTYRLNFLRTQDNLPGNPPVLGPAGCLKPSPVQGGQAIKNFECRWEMWAHEDMLHLDPA